MKRTKWDALTPEQRARMVEDQRYELEYYLRYKLHAFAKEAAALIELLESLGEPPQAAGGGS